MVLALEREKPVGERGADTEHRLGDGSSSDACEPSDDDTAQGEVVGIIKRAERAIAAFMLSDGSSEKSSADVMMQQGMRRPSSDEEYDRTCRHRQHLLSEAELAVLALQERSSAESVARLEVTEQLSCKVPACQPVCGDWPWYCHRSTATRHDAAPDDVIACALILESRFLVSLARWLAGARCGRTDGCLHRPVRSFVCPVTTVCQLVYGRTARLFHYSVLK